eukprot:SAG31_NODE_14555_length_799_cov_1.311429_2_plen_162_part_00
MTVCLLPVVSLDIWDPDCRTGLSVHTDLCCVALVGVLGVFATVVQTTLQCIGRRCRRCCGRFGCASAAFWVATSSFYIYLYILYFIFIFIFYCRLPPAALTILQTTIGFLLVMRTQEASKRWWDGRAAYGQFQALCVDLVRQFTAGCGASASSQAVSFSFR